MSKKRKQAVGREVVIHLDELRAYELNLRAARWKAAAKRWRQMANEYWLVLDKEKADD